MPYVERMRQFSGGRRIQQLQPPGTRAKRAGKDSHQALQEVLKADRLRFRMINPEERLRLGFANLVVRLMQGKPGDKLQLFPRGRVAAREFPVEHRIEFAESSHHFQERKIQPGQPPSLIRHLLDELV